MKKVLLFSLISLIILFIGTGNLIAQLSNTHDLTITVNILEWYDLSIGETTINFDDRPPTTLPPPQASILADENPVSVRVFAILIPGHSIQLTVNAPNDLTKGSGNDIGIEAISWTASGTGFKDGAMSNGVDVLAGEWSNGWYHWHEGNFEYFFARDYTSQEPGAYEATVTYTLSST